jgi:hypothetical protein
MFFLYLSDYAIIYLNFSNMSIPNVNLLRLITDAKMLDKAWGVDHVQYMHDLFSEADRQGLSFSEAAKVGITLNSLSSSYDAFSSHYLSFPSDYAMSNLYEEMYLYDSCHEQWMQAEMGGLQKIIEHMMPELSEESVSTAIERAEPETVPELLPVKIEGKVPLTHLNVLEAYYAGDSSQSWIVDSGATNHVCTSLQVLTSWRELEFGELTLRVGNGQSVSAKAVGKARLKFGDKFLDLESVYFIPNFCRNLVSVSELCKQLYSVSFNNNMIVISKSGLKVCNAILENGLYMIRPSEYYSLNTEMFRVAIPTNTNKKMKVSNDEETYK